MYMYVCMYVDVDVEVEVDVDVGVGVYSVRTHKRGKRGCRAVVESRFDGLLRKQWFTGASRPVATNAFRKRSRFWYTIYY